MTSRAFHLHYARVLLADCAARRHWPASRHFYWTQFAAAQSARREAMGMTETLQGELRV